MRGRGAGYNALRASKTVCPKQRCDGHQGGAVLLHVRAGTHACDTTQNPAEPTSKPRIRRISQQYDKTPPNQNAEKKKPESVRIVPGLALPKGTFVSHLHGLLEPGDVVCLPDASIFQDFS